jgi:hypothetical protein
MQYGFSAVVLYCREEFFSRTAFKIIQKKRVQVRSVVDIHKIADILLENFLNFQNIPKERVPSHACQRTSQEIY